MLNDMDKFDKHYDNWTVEEFRSLPYPDSFWNNIGEIDSLIILPTEQKHDSGYRCMEFVAIQEGVPTYRLSGCSDVLCLGGIGGYNCYGDNIASYQRRIKNQTTPVNDWSFDCLPESGLMRIFCRKKLIVGASVSSIELYFKEEE